MSTISSLLLNNSGSAATSLASSTATQSAKSTTENTGSTPVGSSQTTYTPSVASQLAALTYTSAGLLHSGAPQTQSSAQAAYRAVQDAITQAQNDLMGSSTSATDMFGATNSPTSLPNTSPANSSDTQAQTVLKAYNAAMDAVTQSQASLFSAQAK